MSQPATLQVTAPASFGKAPAAGVARPIPLSASHGRSFSAGVSVRKEWNESNWNICSPLCQVPLGFPLERTHREIYGDAAEVANRISNALRNMSVETEYDGENAKAKCTSLDQVNFRIRLFAGGEDGLPVIVEVQRRCGSSSSFMKICRQILNGAEGGAVAKSRSKPCTRMPPFIKGAIGNMSCLQSVVKKEEGKPELDALNKSIELLKCQKKCSNLLGLENLCFLTDPLKTRPDKALSSCKDIVLGERRAELREKVVAILLQKDAFLPEQYSAELLAKQSRHMALVLLSNSLLLTSKDGCLADAVESQKWFSDTLIPTLLDEVKSFKMSSNNAYEAACSLASLANCSDVAKKIMKENAALEYLRAAHHYGKENHELLSSETELILIALGAPI
jgi:hypothetical protein